MYNLNLNNTHAIHNRCNDNNSGDISSKLRRKFDDATIQSKTGKLLFFLLSKI